jgi:AraC family transcriptional regulator of adaptative response/methylated-DNA-[protein]-cysteine methyltransferase
MNEHPNFERVRDAIRFLRTNYRDQPRLDEVAEEVHLSEYHFQRIFSEWAGISPKKFLKYLTVESLKRDLQTTADLLEVSEKVGLSSMSRVHDLFITMESVTPAEYRNGGEGMEIHYGFHESPFGSCFIAQNHRGICAVSFVETDREAVLNEFAMKWRNARLIEAPELTRDVAEKMFDLDSLDRKFHLLVRGTPFQIKVWEALLKIPSGMVTSYGSVANAIDHSKATRAVGTAIGSNPISFLIPCHRVIRNEGIIGNYHWGPERKTAMIGWEKSRVEGS